MKRRTRLIAATFALVALTFAFAETVLASSCAPSMDMAAMDMHSMDMVAPDGSHDPDHDDTGKDRDCPFGPAAAAQGCSSVASLPSHIMDHTSPSPEGLVSIFVEQTRQDFLLKNALFHPPRA